MGLSLQVWYGIPLRVGYRRVLYQSFRGYLDSLAPSSTRSYRRHGALLNPNAKQPSGGGRETTGWKRPRCHRPPKWIEPTRRPHNFTIPGEVGESSKIYREKQKILGKFL